MDQLFSPWRSEFIGSSKKDDPSGDSPFTKAFKEDPSNDEKNYLVHRGDLAFIIMNRFPYNAGHLLVVPVRQVGHFLDLSEEETAEIMRLVRFGIQLLQKAADPQAFNVGMNLGKTAGAGIESHVHFHIVPRWNGDTNFMPVLGETRVISEGMEEMYRKLKEAENSL